MSEETWTASLLSCSLFSWVQVIASVFFGVLNKSKHIFVRNLPSKVVQYKCCYLVQNCTILEGSRDSRLPPHSSRRILQCTCKVENFATAVLAREVRRDVVVPHSKVSQAVDILGFVCKTEKCLLCRLSQKVYNFHQAWKERQLLRNPNFPNFELPTS